jgi:hypothetical protein
MQLPAVAARNFRKDELGIIKQGQLYLPAEIGNVGLGKQQLAGALPLLPQLPIFR